MKLHEKIEANETQLQIYFESYDRFWRLSKLISLRETLKNREGLQSVYKDFYADSFFPDYELYCYQNITNGVLADALSEVVMYCEDYLGLLKFSREKFYFVKHAINYSAGIVNNVASKLRVISREKTERLFFLPPRDLVETCFARSDVSNAYSRIQEYYERVDLVSELHAKIIRFYEHHRDAHNQYKHGLKIGIGGLHGGGLNPEELERRRREFSGSFLLFQNRSPADLSTSRGLLIPDISSPAIANNATALMKERNLLQLEAAHRIDINELISIAQDIARLLSVLLGNRLNNIDSQRTRIVKIYLPSTNGQSLKVLSHEFQTAYEDKLPTIDDYQFKW